MTSITWAPLATWSRATSSAGGVVAGRDQLAELRRAGDVGALADIDERDLRRELERLEPGEPQALWNLRHAPRRLSGDRVGDGADVLGRGAAAAADDIDQTRAGEFAEQFRHEGRALVVAAERIGQSGVRIGADQRIGDPPDLGDMGAHLARAERAIKPDRERLRVRDRGPERFRRLPRERAARPVRDGAGDHHRQADRPLRKQRLEREDRSLRIQGVEDRLDQQDIDPAVHQPARLLAVGRDQIVEGGGAEARIRNIGRDRGGAVGRPDGAGDEAPLSVFLLGDASRLARELGAGEIQLIGDRLHAVVGLRDARRGEGVGGDDVGAGAEIGQMNIADRIGPRQVEEIVVPPHLPVPGVEARAAKRGLVQPERLDHGAHGAVEHEDALGRERAQLALELRNRRRGGHSLHSPLERRALRTGRRPSRWQIANTRSARFMV